MNSKKVSDLKNTIAAIQKRWGNQAIGKAPKSKTSPVIATGFADLDKVLGGGMPRGGVIEIIGKPTSGMTTVALKTMAEAQKQGDVIVYLDLASAFDPDYAIRCGLNPMDIVLTRYEFPVALDVLFDVVKSGVAGMVVFNAFPRLVPEQRKKLTTVLSRLHPVLAQSRCALLLLTPPYLYEAQGYHLAMRLVVTLEKWLQKGQAVYGYQAQVTVISRTSSGEGKSVHIQITFED